MGHLEAGVADLAGLLTEDGAQQALLGGQLGLALRRDLADEDVTGADFGADADDAAVVEVGEDVVAQVRDVAGDLFRAELRVTGVDLVLLDVDRREHVVLHQALGQDDGVLEVVALPRHERHEQVLAEGEFAEVGRRAVGDDLALDHLVAFDDAGPLVDARVLVRPAELGEVVDPLALGLVLDGDAAAGHLGDLAVVDRLDQVGGVAGGAVLDAGADVRRLGTEQRHGLLLHVRTHQGAVGVVVLEERDERRTDRHDLLRRDVDEVDLFRRHVADVGGGAEEALGFEHLAEVFEAGRLRRPAHERARVADRAVVVERRVGLGDDVVLFLVGGHVDDLAGDLAVLDLAVRALDEAELVDAGVGGQATDQADVRAFRRLDRAHAAVVAEVDVADFEAGTLT